MLQKLANVVDSAYGIVAFFADGEELATGRQGQCGDTLTALDARNEPLHLLLHVVNDNVVATRVRHDVFIKEKDVILDVSFDAEEEAWLG